MQRDGEQQGPHMHIHAHSHSQTQLPHPHSHPLPSPYPPSSSTTTVITPGLHHHPHPNKGKEKEKEGWFTTLRKRTTKRWTKGSGKKIRGARKTISRPIPEEFRNAAQGQLGSGDGLGEEGGVGKGKQREGTGLFGFGLFRNVSAGVGKAKKDKHATAPAAPGYAPNYQYQYQYQYATQGQATSSTPTAYTAPSHGVGSGQHLPSTAYWPGPAVTSPQSEKFPPRGPISIPRRPAPRPSLTTEGHSQSQTRLGREESRRGSRENPRTSQDRTRESHAHERSRRESYDRTRESVEQSLGRKESQRGASRSQTQIQPPSRSSSNRRPVHAQPYFSQEHDPHQRDSQATVETDRLPILLPPGQAPTYTSTVETVSPPLPDDFDAITQTATVAGTIGRGGWERDAERDRERIQIGQGYRENGFGWYGSREEGVDQTRRTTDKSLVSGFSESVRKDMQGGRTVMPRKRADESEMYGYTTEFEDPSSGRTMDVMNGVVKVTQTPLHPQPQTQARAQAKSPPASKPQADPSPRPSIDHVRKTTQARPVPLTQPRTTPPRQPIAQPSARPPQPPIRQPSQRRRPGEMYEMMDSKVVETNAGRTVTVETWREAVQAANYGPVGASSMMEDGSGDAERMSVYYMTAQQYAREESKEREKEREQKEKEMRERNKDSLKNTDSDDDGLDRSNFLRGPGGERQQTQRRHPQQRRIVESTPVASRGVTLITEAGPFHVPESISTIPSIQSHSRTASKSESITIPSPPTRSKEDGPHMEIMAVLSSCKPPLTHLLPIVLKLGMTSPSLMRAVGRMSEDVRDREVRDVAVKMGMTVVEWAVLVERIRSMR